MTGRADRSTGQTTIGWLAGCLLACSFAFSSEWCLSALL